MTVAFPGELPYLFSQQGDHDSPFTYKVPPSLEVVPVAATATFDGTGAAGDFLACLSFYAQSGELLSRVYPTAKVTAGEVAAVSYAPFPGGLTSAATGSGIQFDQNNVGDWLGIECLNTTLGGLTLKQDHAGGFIEAVSDATNSRVILQANADGALIQLNNNSLAGLGGGVQISTDGNLDVGCGGVVDMTGHGASLISQGAGNVAVLQSDDLCQVTSTGGGVIVSCDPNHDVQVNTTFGALEVNTAKLSFFSNTPVAQQATPATLADVIALLQAYGLCP